MGLLNEGQVPEGLAGLHVGHVHDGDGGGGHVLVGVYGHVEAGDIPSAVAYAAHRGAALRLVDHSVIVGHLEHVHLRVVLQDFQAGVGAIVLVKFRVGAHVRGDDNHVGGVADGGNGLFHGHVSGLKGGVLNALLAAVPDGHVRGDHADDGHLHAALLYDGPARAGDKSSVLVQHIGGQHGELGLSQNLEHGGNAPVELMVAQGHGVVAHEVHGGHDGVGLVGRLVVQVVGHDGALNVVARVDENGVGVLGPYLLDVGVQTGHAVVGALLAVLVAVPPGIAVQVGGGQDGQMSLPLGGQGRGDHGGHQCRGQKQCGQSAQDMVTHRQCLLSDFPL